MVVRSGPSLTGLLHVENVHPALFNWLFARRQQGNPSNRHSEAANSLGGLRIRTAQSKEQGNPSRPVCTARTLRIKRRPCRSPSPRDVSRPDARFGPVSLRSRLLSGVRGDVPQRPAHHLQHADAR
ncbi:MAG TPA: hypothetical protein VKY24_16305 [Reyranella sp.]|nr:hypothetical protein [Reyranella sp.]